MSDVELKLKQSFDGMIVKKSSLQGVFSSLNLPALFKNDKDYEKFKKRHSKASVKRKDLSKHKGDIFLGIDAGSTTCKVVAIDNKGDLLYENYKSNKGTPVDTVKEMLLEFQIKQLLDKQDLLDMENY